MCRKIHGAPLMDIQAAKRFELHMNECIEELSSALLLAQQSCAADDFLVIRKSVGEIIGHIDTLLYDSMYGDHPELNKLKTQK